MIRKNYFDVYYGGHMHVGTVSAHKLKKMLKRDFIVLTTKCNNKILDRWYARVDDLMIVPKGADTGL